LIIYLELFGGEISLKISFNSLGYGSYGKWIPAYSLEEAIKRIAKFGYNGIEIGAWRPHAWPYDLDNNKIRKIRKNLKEYNLKVSAICPVNHNLNLASSFKEERMAAIDYYLKCINLATELESDIVVCVPGWRIYGTLYSEAYKLSLNSVNTLAKEAEKNHIYIAIESVNRNIVNLINTSEQAYTMMRDIDSPFVKLMLDTYHVMYEKENSVDVIELYNKDLVHIHCQDGIIEPPLRKVPGEGMFGFKSFFSKLKSIKYNRYLSVELWGENPDELALKSHLVLTDIIRKLNEH